MRVEPSSREMKSGQFRALDLDRYTGLDTRRLLRALLLVPSPVVRLDSARSLGTSADAAAAAAAAVDAASTAATASSPRLTAIQPDSTCAMNDRCVFCGITSGTAGFRVVHQVSPRRSQPVGPRLRAGQLLLPGPDAFVQDTGG